MQSQNPLIADFVKLANSAAGTFAGMTREARESARERAKEAFGGMDFVTREEFEAVREMAIKARTENAELREMARRLREEPNAIEEQARRELGLIKPGEMLFIIKDIEKKNP